MMMRLLRLKHSCGKMHWNYKEWSIFMAYIYLPQGVCSREFQIELEGETVKKIDIKGGCDGNLQGLARLVEGMNARDAISKIRGIRCGRKSTSCPDQLSIALEKALGSK
jgi:uncharacterized protein (TIGR03905 family)